MKHVPFVQTDAEEWLKRFRFSVPIKPRYSETDMSGHVNNISYFIYFEQGRIDYLEHLGLAETLFDQDSMAVVADLECKFLMQTYIHDRLRLYVRTAKVGRSSLDIEYALVEEASGALKAAARGAMVHIDRQSGKSRPLPEIVQEKIRGLEGVRMN